MGARSERATTSDTMPAELELGTLVIVILKARNLIDKHSFYKQDVFAQVSLNGVSKRTPVDVKGGQHPVWDAEIRLPVMKDAGEKYRKLEVGCYAQEHKMDDLLGEWHSNFRRSRYLHDFY
jgi:Ca2+-dependent lipid-binding protein